MILLTWKGDEGNQEKRTNTKKEKLEIQKNANNYLQFAKKKISFSSDTLQVFHGFKYLL